AGNVNGSSSPTNVGGGLYVSGGSLTLNQCIFSANIASLGGGMYLAASSAPLGTHCTFKNNTAILLASNGNGGGVYSTASAPSLSDCTFTNNTALAGGAMFNSASSGS